MEKRDKGFSKHPIRHTFYGKLILSVISIILIMACFITVSSYNLAGSAINEIEFNLIETSAEKTFSLLNSAFRSVEDSLTRLISLPVVREYAEKTNLNPDEVKENDRFFRSGMGDYMKQIETEYNTNDIQLVMVSIFLKNGLTYSSVPNTDLPFSDFLSGLEYMKNVYHPSVTDYYPMTWLGTIETNNNYGVQIRSCICMRYLYDRVTMEKIGVVVAGIDEEAIRSIYKSTFSNALIIQGDGIVLSATDLKKIGIRYENPDLLEQTKKTTWAEGHFTNSILNESNVYIYGKNEFYMLYFLIPYHRTLLPSESARVFTQKSILIAVLSLFLGIVAAYILSKKMSSNIIKLKHSVQKVYEGDLKARYPQKSKNVDEIEYIGRQFNDMMEGIEEFYRIQKKDAEDKKNLEIQLLQSQINPHLLYNTLESAVWAIKSNDTARAEKLIYSLSIFFRAALSKGRDHITLEEELEILRSYIMIQNLARRKQFVLQEEIAPEMYSCTILRMTLQPLLENAIVHGFSGYEKGTVRIRLDLLPGGRDVEISVRDNGIGIDEKKIAELNESIDRKKMDASKKHFGLYNVNQRIRKHYGNEYGLKIFGEIGDFTEIRIKLPYVLQSE